MPHKDLEQARQKANARTRKSYQKHRIKRLKNSKEKDREIHGFVKEAMGGTCSCCNEAELEFLSLDHIHEDGNKERKKNGYAQNNRPLYRKLKKMIEGQEEITEHQLLCRNCNWSKHVGHGVCAHKRKSQFDNSIMFALTVEGGR